MKTIFRSFFDLDSIYKKSGIQGRALSYIIGSDGKIYILIRPEGMNGMFADKVSDSRYYLFILDADYINSVVLSWECLDLGIHKMNYTFALPYMDNILLADTRCGYGDNNAVIADKHGNILREFCLGDGIADIITTHDGEIITSYFDEGIFGNYGWDEPVGANGLVVWDKDIKIKWEADTCIDDCYAMNVDETDHLWYYYYSDFRLIRTDRRKNTVYDPKVSGADAFLITADGQSLVMNCGYKNNSEFFAAPLSDLGRHEDIELYYHSEKLTGLSVRFYRSYAVFVDENSGRMFLQYFNNIPKDQTS